MTDKVVNEAVVEDSNGNPNALETLTEKFKGFNFMSNDGKMFGELVNVPPEVERRLKALKKLQMEMFSTECKFFEELHDLETKYAKLYAKTWNKRGEIIAGKYEPTEEECDFKIPGVEEEKKDDVVEDKTTATPVSGIPNFWLTVLQNVEQFSDTIEERDIPILEHLEDITMELVNEPMGFKLSFHFSPNEYFTNPVLTKTYEMRIQVDPKDPFSFEGTEIYKSTGCEIDWKEGKNVTVREVKKKQKHKSTGAIRLSSKMVQNPSFFDFFKPPQIDDNDEDNLDPEVQDKVTTDFELGSFLKERLIPRAVLYYTGEALESDDEDEEEEEFSGEDTENEGGSSNDPHNDDSATENEGED